MSSKKRTSVLIVIVCLAVLLGVLISSTLIAKNSDPNEKVKRVLIKPNDSKSELEIRQNKDVEIKHEFEGKFSADVPESLIAQLHNFAEAILNHGEPFITGNEGKRSIALIEACYAASKPLILPWIQQ